MLNLGGVSAASLADRYDTPLYVYEAARIRAAYATLKRAFDVDDLRIHFATKANSNPWILRILAQEGAWADVVSPGEIVMARTAGFPARRLLYNGNSASDAEMRAAVEHGVRINVESMSQLRRLGALAPGVAVSIRFNIYVGGGHHSHVITGGPESKFGIDWEQADEARALAAQGRLRVAGVHCHIGSGVLQAERFVAAVTNLLTVAQRFPDLEQVNFGGGIGIPYRRGDQELAVDRLGALLTGEYERFCASYGARPALCLEPGRFLVARSGTLLCRVTAVNQARKYLFAGTDSGFNHLVRPAMYGSYHHIEAVEPRAGEPRDTVLTGNICESGDVFTRDEEGIVPRALPPLEEGDLVAIRDAGAYGFAMASRYNSFPLPAEVLVEDGADTLIRRRDTLPQLLENIPALPEGEGPTEEGAR
ncbi:MAG: diaminopimelate decarboxylase [Spirochaetaceae bacterium]|nr:diaminopimelate decarboxylase [Spirochaetaceae bacterium]